MTTISKNELCDAMIRGSWILVNAANVVRETAKAVLVRDEHENKPSFKWYPKSQIRAVVYDNGRESMNAYRVPMWLAKQA